MPNVRWQEMLAACVCVAVLVWIAFFGAYAGDASNKPPPSPAEVQKPNHKESTQTSNRSDSQQYGSPKAITRVERIPSTKTSEDSNAQKEESDEKTGADWWTVWLTGVLALIGAIQTGVFGLQARRLRETIKKMDEVATGQTRDMANSIAEASRAAGAMENVAVSLKINADMIVKTVEINRLIGLRQYDFGIMQIRPYVSVLIGGACFQDRAQNIRFETYPVIRNTGNSPAYQVRTRIAAEVLTTPLPKNFRFPLPNAYTGGAILTPHSPSEIRGGIVVNFVPDNEVDDIKNGIGRSLYVWGYVTYRDIFNKTRRITFAQQILFPGLPSKEIVKGYYLIKHNRAN